MNYTEQQIERPILDAMIKQTMALAYFNAMKSAASIFGVNDLAKCL